MSKHIISLLLIVVPLLGFAQTLVIKNVAVVDVKTGTVIRGQIVVINGNKIASVNTTPPIPKTATVIDGTGKYLIPGLWDMHSHSLTDNRYGWVFHLLIANGITGVREMGSNMSLDSINLIKQKILQGKILGPRFGAVTGRIVDGEATKVYEAVAVRTPDEARKLVIQYKASGMDFIKPYDAVAGSLFSDYR